MVHGSFARAIAAAAGGGELLEMSGRFGDEIVLYAASGSTAGKGRRISVTRALVYRERYRNTSPGYRMVVLERASTGDPELARDFFFRYLERAEEGSGMSETAFSDSEEADYAYLMDGPAASNGWNPPAKASPRETALSSCLEEGGALGPAA